LNSNLSNNEKTEELRKIGALDVATYEKRFSEFTMTPQLKERVKAIKEGRKYGVYSDNPKEIEYIRKLEQEKMGELGRGLTDKEVQTLWQSYFDDKYAKIREEINQKKQGKEVLQKQEEPEEEYTLTPEEKNMMYEEVLKSFREKGKDIDDEVVKQEITDECEERYKQKIEEKKKQKSNEK
jgi:hypothetical protein